MLAVLPDGDKQGRVPPAGGPGAWPCLLGALGALPVVLFLCLNILIEQIEM